MSTVIRKGVFETNSSSTHSICVAKDGEYRLPSSIEFVSGEFGWEVSELRSTEEKASYLYTGLLAHGRDEQISLLGSRLAESGVIATFNKHDDFYGDDDIGYVDHSAELLDFLNAVQDKDELFRYLFSDRSFILTGNDNGGDYERNDPGSAIYETHAVYYKGN